MSDSWIILSDRSLEEEFLEQTSKKTEEYG